MALYNVLVARVQKAQTDIEIGGVIAKAEVPAFVVHLAPTEFAEENGVIKLVYPSETSHAPFVEGAQVEVSFQAA